MAYTIIMYEGTLIELLKEVVKSWQVLAVTVVLVFYIFLVNRAARVYRYKRSKAAKKPKPKKKAKDNSEPIIEDDSNSSNDELGLS